MPIVQFSVDVLSGYNQSKSTLNPLIAISTGAVSRVNPVKTPLKSVTPGSVKALMILEAGIISFLAFWLYNEYSYNIYFRIYVDTMIVAHITTYTVVLGLGIGLAGSAAAATLYRNLQHAKHTLERVTLPKIKGTVEKIMSSVPTIDERLPNATAKETTLAPVPTTTPTSVTPAASNVTAIVPVIPPEDQKKSA